MILRSLAVTRTFFQVTGHYIAAQKREIRRVTAGWQHPRNEKGHFIPLFKAADLDSAYDDFHYELDGLVEKGVYADREEALDANAHRLPDPSAYMSEFANPTHVQAYETTTEGTPISPVFDSESDLVTYLAEHAGLFGGRKGTADEWRLALELA